VTEQPLTPGVNVKAGERFLRSDDLEPVWRTPLGLVALAAWLNVKPEQLPTTPNMRAYTCRHTMEAWGRVGEAVAEYVRGQ
jgi:hypothetical protein